VLSCCPFYFREENFIAPSGGVDIQKIDIAGKGLLEGAIFICDAWPMFRDKECKGR
jgi:hypothetical protein